MNNYVPEFGKYIAVNEAKLMLKDIDPADEKATKQWIGVRGPGHWYSSLSLALLLKRVKEFNAAKGTHHSVDKQKVGESDNYTIVFNFGKPSKDDTDTQLSLF